MNDHPCGAPAEGRVHLELPPRLTGSSRLAISFHGTQDGVHDAALSRMKNDDVAVPVEV